MAGPRARPFDPSPAGGYNPGRMPRERASDDEIAEKAVSGDRAAFEELVRRYMNIVVGFALSYTGDPFAAEDLAQESFIKAFESLRKLEDPSKFGGWLRVICRNTCADYVRSRRTPVSLEALRASGQEPTDSSATPFEDVSGSETQSAVMREIASLREDYREIIVLRHIEDLSYKKIAALLGMSVSAVGEKLSRVRDILKRRLRKKVK